MHAKVFEIFNKSPLTVKFESTDLTQIHVFDLK